MQPSVRLQLTKSHTWVMYFDIQWIETRFGQGGSNPEDIIGIIGMVTQLSKFLKNLSALCEPLRQLKRQDVPWTWTAEHDDALQKIKNAVTQTPALKYFNSEDETNLQCNASQSGLGAALTQNGRRVSHASRTLTEMEQQYAQIEKETLAVVYGLDKFHSYTYGLRLWRPATNQSKRFIGSRYILPQTTSTNA